MRNRDAALPAAGLSLAACAALFLTGIMVGASIAPSYDYHGAAISDLGVIAQTAALFNALLIIVGILNIAGGYFFYRSHGRAWLLGAFTLAGIGAVGAGLQPLSTGTPHSLFALVGFVFFNVEALGTAIVVKGVMRAVSALAGVVGLAYVVVMIIGDGGNPSVFGPIGHGGSERMIVYPAMLWLLALGGHLMVGDREG